MAKQRKPRTQKANLPADIQVVPPIAPKLARPIPSDIDHYSYLPPKVLMFIQAYLADPSIARAAHQAGISYQDGIDLLRNNHNVQKAIREGRKELVRLTTIEPYHVLEELKKIAFSDISEYQIDPNTGQIIITGNSPDAIRAIASVKRRVTRRLVPGNEQNAPEVTIEEQDTEVKLWSKVEALKEIAKILGMVDRKTGESEPTKVYVNLNLADILNPRPPIVVVESLPVAPPSPLPDPADAPERTSYTQEPTTKPSSD